MCEILTIKGNNQGIKFNKEDIRKARDNNPDGAGYVIFEKRKGSWEIFDFETFGETEGGWNWDDKSKSYWRLPDKSEKPDFATDRIYLKQKELENNKLMIAHFRLATSGNGIENTQPILKNDYLVIHNGILGFKSLPVGFSDTKYFTKRLQEASRKAKVKTPKQEKAVIEKVLKYAGGSYSMFIYSYITKKIYYIKNEMTGFCQSYDEILGSTRVDRLPLIYSHVESNNLVDV